LCMTMCRSDFYLYAPNIHQGGGKTLLLPLLAALQNIPDISFVLDARISLPQDLQLRGDVYRIKATLFSRLWFEWRLRSLITPDTLLLCMGNLPPLFAHQGIQQVFVQNRYLIEDVSLDSFPLPVRIRLTAERWWLRSRSDYVDRFIVQTETMQRLIKDALGVDAAVLPFAAIAFDMKLNHADRYDFLYVASGEPHKNHKRLIEAWIHLGEKSMFPSLCLTLDEQRFPGLCAWISAKIKKHHLNVSMIGECSHAKIQQLYHRSRAMIYPSRFESFGLPLIEAAMAGLPILASSETYVTDVIEPSSLFDASSSQSIADAVRGFRGRPAKLKVHLYDANEFLERVFNDG